MLVVARVGERDFAAMVFQNLAHDGEPESGAFRARRHIGLGQPMAMLGRQADAVVRDAKRHASPFASSAIDDASRPVVAGRFARVDGFASRSSARWSAPARQAGRRIRNRSDSVGALRLEGDLRMRDALQEHRLVQQFLRVLAAHHGRRHAREGGEFVHHAADIAHLADDRVGALLEDFGIGGDFLAVFALQPLGRKLDRRQRVLDLVCDAARDIGPGGGALRGDEIGDVVEGDDEAASSAPLSLATCTLRLRTVPPRLTVASPLARPTGSCSARRMSPASSGTASA